MAHFVRQRLWRQAEKMLLGMLAFYGLGALLLALDWRIALGYWFLPQWMTVLFLSAVAYTWHAFAEPGDPGNDYVSAVTFLEGHYNVFNEDYHVVHHQAPLLHWSENPAHYQSHLDEYRRNFATAFRDTQTFELFFWIVLRRYDLMTDHFVDLSGTLTRKQITELLLRRLRPIPPDSSPRAMVFGSAATDQAIKALTGIPGKNARRQDRMATRPDVARREGLAEEAPYSSRDCTCMRDLAESQAE